MALGLAEAVGDVVKMAVSDAIHALVGGGATERPEGFNPGTELYIVEKFGTKVFGEFFASAVPACAEC